MILTGVKIICERSDGAITTWHDGAKPVHDVIEGVMINKNWVGGKVIEAYYEFDNDGSYVKIWIDVAKNKLSDLLNDS